MQEQFLIYKEQVLKMELEYRKKLIKLEKELQYETNRAEDFQLKFKEAVLQSQSAHAEDLLMKLNAREDQLHTLRTKLLHFEQESNNCDQIKQAAIAAIMMKDEQIDRLNEQIESLQEMYTHLKEQLEDQEHIHKAALAERDEDIKLVNETLTAERQHYFSRLETLQTQYSSEEGMKEVLYEKTLSLETNLEESNQAFNASLARIQQLEQLLQKQKRQSDKEMARISIELQQTKQALRGYQKEERHIQKELLEKTVQGERQEEEITELKRKLAIKKKKENGLANKIYSSFIDYSPASPFSQLFSKVKEVPEEVISMKKGIAVSQIQQLSAAMENVQFEDINDLVIEDGNPERKQSFDDKKLKAAYEKQEELNALLKTATSQLQQERKVSMELRQQMKKTSRESELTVQLENIRQHVYKLENALLIEKLRSAETNEYNLEKNQRDKAALNGKIKELQLQAETKKKKSWFSK